MRIAKISPQIKIYMEIERGSPYKSLFALFICNRTQNPVTLKIIA